MSATKEPPGGTCLLTKGQTAQRLAISKRTLERLIAHREFPRPLKIGRSSRVPIEDVAAYLERLQTQRSEQGGTS
jgi:excisionase family DNA binding protein